MTWRRIAVALMSGAGMAGCASAPRARMLEAMAPVGRPAPDFQLASLDGSKVTLSELNGRPVMLAFWAYG